MQRSKVFFIAWCMIAAFGTYFCMYAFRKPFTTGTYEGEMLHGIHFKTLLIVAQVLGYMCSKFLGIKVISELRAASRQKLIIGLIVFAEAALLLFGVVPAPYNLWCLFLNGLPLGMVWGVVFSYLEGRRFTEVLGMGLSISLIVSSGYLKTIYFMVHEWLPRLDEYWLPAIIGLLFLPVFLFFVWMLRLIPSPTETDRALRVERKPMTKADKSNALRTYGWGIGGFVLLYVMLATMRDFRDNFSVEIWNEIEPGWNKNVFSITETICGVVVLLAIGSLSMIKSNYRGFAVTQYLIAAGLLLCGAATVLFNFGFVSPFNWMLWSGTGMFLAYTPIQVAVFERMIALFRIRSNAGFFVYICDANGYLGSVALLLFKEFLTPSLQWSVVLENFCLGLSVLGLIMLIISAHFFRVKLARGDGERRKIQPTAIKTI